MANLYYYRGRQKEKSSKWNTVKQALPFVWLILFGLFSFFAPFLIDSISFFKAKAVNVYGDQNIPPKVVANAIGAYKRNWLFMNASGIKDKLEKATGNAIDSVAVKKDFKGILDNDVVVDVYIKERKPIAVVVNQNKSYLMDDKGDLFDKKYFNTKGLTIIYTPDIEKTQKEVKLWLKPIANYLKQFKDKNIFITNSGIFVDIKDINGELILPLSNKYDKRQLLERLNIILNYGPSYLANKILDLRYNKFITIREKENKQQPSNPTKTTTTPNNL
ncbi:MAG: cell division septal protein [Hydrogenobaculum sp.]|nr:MAG: cell division septal protein [Hydrogenobaculum sp.]PMP93399.1 MAG: cell division septal protein [Hydrogenobaculum sp.]